MELDAERKRAEKEERKKYAQLIINAIVDAGV